MWHGPAYVVTLCLCVYIPHLNLQTVTINAEGSHANQQVSKVEEEGDDNRDEGSAGADQDEVGCKHLVGGVRVLPKDILRPDSALPQMSLSVEGIQTT